MNCENWGFCDLSINRDFDISKLEEIKNLGYSTIAINTYVEESNDEPKKKKRKGDNKPSQDYIPAPLPLEKESLQKLNILQRVTIEFSDSSISHKLNLSENLKKYDIIAVVPKTLAAFQYASGTLDVDIISFEPSIRMQYKVSRKLYRQAVDRGIFFELMYVPAIRDSTSRKNIIGVAHTYHAVGKSKNVIITSGALSDLYLRDVHDVINIGFLLGLSNNQSLESMKNNPRTLIIKAKSRRCGKLFLTVERLENIEKKVVDS